MITKLRLVFAITIVFLSFSSYAQHSYWQQDVSTNNFSRGFSERFKVQKGKVFSFNEKAFQSQLKNISTSKQNAKTVYFPDADGKTVPFQVYELPVFSEELSRKYPNIKSYYGHAIDGSKSRIRFSVSHKGVQSMIVHTDHQGTTFMQKDRNDQYVVYSRNPNSDHDADFVCHTKSTLDKTSAVTSAKIVDGQELRKFRLAIAASGEYTQFHGGTVADALAAINATVTRINEVFETDLGVRLEVIPNTDEVIFINAATDPFTGNLNNTTQATFRNTIGEANYDVGILLNQANQSDGNAGFIGSVCVDNQKGSSFATGAIPEGDLFDLDFVAHELGHQFGANHTWSFESEFTGVQVEPGSGTTIMGYAGITGINDVADNGDDYFHYMSIVQITEYLSTVSCGETMALTNNPPTVNPLGSFTIPLSTPFVLTADATDIDVDDVLTFAWEQIDDGVVPQRDFGPTNIIGANFRSQKPSTNSSRYFPKLSSVVAGKLTETSPTTSSDWETLSKVEREFNFALTVRDNATGGGQVVSDLVNVFVDNSAGPFTVTSQNTNQTIVAGSTEEVVWDVANTNNSPINAQTVDIFLSTDGGNSFPILLVEGVPNDGSHSVQFPANPTTQARVMVKAHNNIFFSVNTSDFTITETEIVLNFENLEQEVCQPDVLIVPFVYETFLGFAEEATFSTANPPAGVDIAIFPETATLTDTPVDITFTNTDNLAPGVYPIEILATTASLTESVTFNLAVFDTNFPTIALTSPSDTAVDISTRMDMEWEADTMATSYIVEIATDAAFASVIETASVISNRYTPTNLENLNTYFWRVKPVNICGEGTFSAPFSFTTIAFSCENKAANDLPITISATGTPTVSSKILVQDDLVVSDIDVNAIIDHSFLADLTVTLTSPSGTTVVLISNSCDEQDNINATFDDDAPEFVCGSAPAISGTVKPLGALSSFNGESSFGEWILTVSDNAPSDGGVIRDFSLEICAEGEFRPDADRDGVFDDGPDLCLDTPLGSTVDTTGCPILVVASSNYRVEANSESCRSSNDGSIVIDVQQDFSYTATLTGNGVNETNDFSAPTASFADLSAGTYALCIVATDSTLLSQEQCFDVVINEPEVLNVSALVSLDGSSVDLTLAGGAIYNIELNGIVSQVEDATFQLNLKRGLNTLKVTTNLPCQGSYEQQFLFGDSPLVYPNPFDDVIHVFLGNSEEAIAIRVFAQDGKMVAEDTYSVEGAELELDLSFLTTGLYFVRFESETLKATTKLVKK